MSLDYYAILFTGFKVLPEVVEIKKPGCKCNPDPSFKNCSNCGSISWYSSFSNPQIDLLTDLETSWTYHGYDVLLPRGDEFWYFGKNLGELDPRCDNDLEIQFIESDTKDLFEKLKSDKLEIVSNGLFLVSDSR